IEWDNNMNLLDWSIIGGESGNDFGKHRYRPMEMVWMEKLIDTSVKNNVKCFVKQLGTYQAKILNLKDKHGGDIDEWDSYLQIREFPEKRKPFDLFYNSEL
ncbi:DUF5131 family protein, partial [Chryseobacterium sp. EO14]|uniref:DUF5131 family protein n=1 Tax=Chryseobacterium sp. EO14 TaxID=2950551 RepID=UPI00210CC8A5